MDEPTEYECTLVGCDFVGTEAECLAHEADDPSHHDFWSVPSWDELEAAS